MATSWTTSSMVAVSARTSARPRAGIILEGRGERGIPEIPLDEQDASARRRRGRGEIPGDGRLSIARRPGGDEDRADIAIAAHVGEIGAQRQKVVEAAHRNAVRDWMGEIPAASNETEDGSLQGRFCLFGGLQPRIQSLQEEDGDPGEQQPDHHTDRRVPHGLGRRRRVRRLSRGHDACCVRPSLGALGAETADVCGEQRPRVARAARELSAQEAQLRLDSAQLRSPVGRRCMRLRRRWRSGRPPADSGPSPRSTARSTGPPGPRPRLGRRAGPPSRRSALVLDRLERQQLDVARRLSLRIG